MISFTPRAQQALALARREADRLKHNFVGTEHLLLGLLILDQDAVADVLKKMGADLSAIRKAVEEQIGPGPVAGNHPLSEKIPYTPRVKQVLVLAGKEAKAFNHRHIGTQHLLLGLMREGDGVAARVLTTLGIDLERTRAEIIGQLDLPAGEEGKPLPVPEGEVDRIRQELAVLKSKVEMISLTVDEASQRTQPPASSPVATSLRRLSAPQPPTTVKTVFGFLNGALWFVAFVMLVRMIVNRFRRP